MEKMPLAGSLGRICPAPCEVQCRRREVDAPLAICQLKRFAADQVDRDTLPTPDIEKKPDTEKVAIIDAGPAGLSAAYFLAKKGYHPTIFEKAPFAGGMLRAGIPDYRLPPRVLDQEVNYIKRLGVDLARVEGSGPGGRIVKRDVEAARESVPAAAAVPAALAAVESEFEDVPVSQMRKTIAKRLVESIGPVPHFFLTIDVDMGRVIEAKQSMDFRQAGRC